MKNCLRRLSLSITLLSCASMAQAQTKSLQLSAGMHLIQAEVAATEAQREQGLMYREKMAANAGMLFVFGTPSTQCMWMKNTPLPLSAAFMDEQGRIVDVIDLEPLSTAIRCSREPARYALEVNQGWFRQHRQGVGDQVKGIPTVD